MRYLREAVIAIDDGLEKFANWWDWGTFWAVIFAGLIVELVLFLVSLFVVHWQADWTSLAWASIRHAWWKAHLLTGALLAAITAIVIGWMALVEWAKRPKRVADALRGKRP